jgi:hypothetical protein
MLISDGTLILLRHITVYGRLAITGLTTFPQPTSLSPKPKPRRRLRFEGSLPLRSESKANHCEWPNIRTFSEVEWRVIVKNTHNNCQFRVVVVTVGGLAKCN